MNRLILPCIIGAVAAVSYAADSTGGERAAPTRIPPNQTDSRHGVTGTNGDPDGSNPDHEGSAGLIVLSGDAPPAPVTVRTDTGVKGDVVVGTTASKGTTVQVGVNNNLNVTGLGGESVNIGAGSSGTITHAGAAGSGNMSVSFVGGGTFQMAPGSSVVYSN